jgi:predicted HicB family RNase H-like nuclease
MKPTITQIKEAARRYLKIVECDDDDQCYVGSAPPLIGQSGHGKTESNVIKQLQAIVEEWVELLLVDGKPLPEGTADRRFSGKFVVRLSPEIHRKAALKAMARGESLNEFVSETLARSKGCLRCTLDAGKSLNPSPIYSEIA